MIFSIAATRNALILEESVSFVLDGVDVVATELASTHGTRLHRLTGGAGTMVVEYSATVGDPIPRGSIGAELVEQLDEILYRRPSRYCESDILLPTAKAEFQGLTGHELLAAVTEWVALKIRYVSGSSNSSDSAVRTLLTRRGVCRDFAHLVIALLRGLDIPARMVAVYAPGLAPMDFHAVAEAYVDGQWWLLDATRLAPRQTMVRIATGRDASDIAFLSNYWAHLSLTKLEVTALASPVPDDDVTMPFQLA
jgi:transglutaminase-like putative cysteine protease